MNESHLKLVLTCEFYYYLKLILIFKFYIPKILTNKF